MVLGNSWLLGLWLISREAAAQDNIPDADTFLRAAYWRGESVVFSLCQEAKDELTEIAVTLGDFIYIDGGQVSQEGFTDPFGSHASR